MVNFVTCCTYSLRPEVHGETFHIASILLVIFLIFLVLEVALWGTVAFLLVLLVVLHDHHCLVVVSQTPDAAGGGCLLSCETITNSSNQ